MKECARARIEITAGVSRAADDQELRFAELFQGCREVEAIAYQQPYRHQAGAVFVEHACGGVGVGVVDDEGREVGVRDRERGGQDGAETGSIGNDGSRGEMPGAGQVVKCGVGVLGHAALIGVSGVACAEASVVEGEYVSFRAVERGELVNGIGERAFAIVQVEEGWAVWGSCWNPPCGKAWPACGGCIKADRVEGNGQSRGGAVHFQRRMQEQLPGALVDEKAKREVCEYGRDGNDEAENLDQPSRVDYFWGHAGERRTDLPAWMRSRFRHGGLPARVAPAVEVEPGATVYDEAEVSMGQWVRLCGVGEAPTEGKVSEAEARGIFLCLARVNGELLAVDNWCPHRQGPLGQGWVEGNTVVCPWHAWSFDVRTGRSEFPENERVAIFPVKVEGEEVLVDMGEVVGTGNGSTPEQL